MTSIIALLFAPLLATAAPTPDRCADRLQGVNAYQDLVDGKVIEDYSYFPLQEWSDHSSFDHLVVKSTEPEKIRLEFEIRKTRSGAPVVKTTHAFKSWKADKNYRVADLEPKKVFEKYDRGFYFVRLANGTETLCEDTHRIEPAD